MFLNKNIGKNANFNIEGKYLELSFDVGKVDGASNLPNDGDFDVLIYSDGELVKTLTVKTDELPISVNIPLENTERLTFEVEVGTCTLVGFLNVKLFYRYFNDVSVKSHSYTMVAVDM